MASPFCKVGRETAHEGSAISRVAELKLVCGFTPIGAEGEGGHFPFAFNPSSTSRRREFGTSAPQSLGRRFPSGIVLGRDSAQPLSAGDGAVIRRCTGRFGCALRGARRE